jgi:hypothetical protein
VCGQMRIRGNLASLPKPLISGKLLSNTEEPPGSNQGVNLFIDLVGQRAAQLR